MKLIGTILSILITVFYVIGFLYDASFLESFGVNYYEMIGSPLDYLSIGGMYILFHYTNNLTPVVLTFGSIGVCYIPLKNLIQKHKSTIEKHIHIESIPYVLVGTIPIALLLMIPVIPNAKEEANNTKSEIKDKICIDNKKECYEGVILRYRDSKIIFFNNKTQKTYVFTDKKLINAEHS